MSDVSCPLPHGIDHTKARGIFDKVRKENPKLTASAQRREAARRMGTDYDTYLNAWKKPTTGAGLRPPASSTIGQALRAGSYPPQFDVQMKTALTWSDDLTHGIVAKLDRIEPIRNSAGSFATATSSTRLLVNPRIFTDEFDTYWKRVGGKRHLLNDADVPAHVAVVQHELGHYVADGTSAALKYRAFAAFAKDLGIPLPPAPRTFSPYMTDLDKWLKKKSVVTRIGSKMGTYPISNSEELFAELWRLHSIDRDRAPSWVRAWWAAFN